MFHNSSAKLDCPVRQVESLSISAIRHLCSVLRKTFSFLLISASMKPLCDISAGLLLVSSSDCYLDLLLTNSTNLQILRRQCCLHQPGGRERVEVALDLGDTVLERQQPLPQKTLKHRPHARPMDIWVFFGYKHFSRVTRARNRTRRATIMRTKWNLWTSWRTKRCEQQQAETVIWMVFRPAWHTCKT